MWCACANPNKEDPTIGRAHAAAMPVSRSRADPLQASLQPVAYVIVEARNHALKMVELVVARSSRLEHQMARLAEDRDREVARLPAHQRVDEPRDNCSNGRLSIQLAKNAEHRTLVTAPGRK